jgi:hypothetical protein
MRQGVRPKRRRGGAIAFCVTGITMREPGARRCPIAADVMSAAIGILGLR